MKKWLMLLAAMLVCVPLSAQAVHNDVDMSKVTCTDWLDKKADAVAGMLIWLDGYMSAKSENTVMSDAWTEKLHKHIDRFCTQQTSKTIMDALHAME